MVTSILEDVRRWRAASAETATLLRRNEELLERRATLIDSVHDEFRAVVRLAMKFADEARRQQRAT